ncbi:MAG: P1 family peptidase [Caldilineaceae bacterium]
MNGTLTDVPGLSVGHWTDRDAATGCTVILCPPDGAIAGVDVRGFAPGTREIALLDPVCMVEKVHAVLLSGGSAFGLAAADGVMHWLEAQGRGFDTGIAKVPIVPAAILFDLGIGRGRASWRGGGFRRLRGRYKRPRGSRNHRRGDRRHRGQNGRSWPEHERRRR